MEVVFIIIFLTVGAAVAMRLVAGGMDRERIRSYVETHGGTYLEAFWAPFGPGWLGARGDRIYVVRHLDRDGKEHAMYCRTSHWTGVYFTEDRIIRHADSPLEELEELRRENRLLREELARLRHPHAGQEQNAIKELKGGNP